MGVQDIQYMCAPILVAWECKIVKIASRDHHEHQLVHRTLTMPLISP